MKPRPVFYNCDNCPSYCCSYAQIEVEQRDIERLASYLGLEVEIAARRLTMEGKDPGTRIMRHFRDPVFGTVCRLLDQQTRRCKAYVARPNACRIHPGTPSCHYYQFLMVERRIQGKPDLAVRAYNLVGSSGMSGHGREKQDPNEGD